MHFYEFGEENEKRIVMIHGLSMTWDMTQDAIDILKQDFHVIAVAVPGHDIVAKDEFTSVEDIAKRIEDWLISKNYSELECLYGLSMGGGISIRILADDVLKIKTAVIDAGITPYEMPYLFTRAILLNDFCTTMLGRRFPSLLKYMFPLDRFPKELIEKETKGLQSMTAKSIWRAYDSTDNYSMPELFPSLDTHIEYWYGGDEAKDRKLDIRYVEKTIPNVILQEIPHMLHGEFICSHPEEFCNKLCNVLMREGIKT